VTVLPVLVTYAISRPARSIGLDAAFVSSTYSSDAEAPPVTISATSRPVDAGHPTTAWPATRAGATAAGAASAVAPTARIRTIAANAAIRARAIEDLRAGHWRQGTGDGSLGRGTYPRLNRDWQSPVGGDPVRCTGRTARPAAGSVKEAPSLARAKRTDRTEARRRHRAEQAAQTPALEDDSGEATSSGSARSARSTSPAPAAPAQQRPSFSSAFRAAFRPADLRGDLRSLPRIVTHWGFLGAAAASIAATVVFILSTNEFASTLDLSLSDPAAGRPIGTVSNISYIVVSLFVAPPPAAGAFLVGFTAQRASWLGGLLFGLIAAACYSVILLSPTGRLFIGGNDPQPFILNAWIVSPLGAMFFAAASAWYKRFLSLANPNRGRPPAKPAPKGRGNARPNSRVTG
jgi:hypothetical protein